MNHAVIQLREERRVLIAQLQEVRATAYQDMHQAEELSKALYRNLQEVSEAIILLLPLSTCEPDPLDILPIPPRKEGPARPAVGPIHRKAAT